MGDRAPDVVFGSPPCQGYSRLISSAVSATPKYQELNRLVLVWIELVLATWAEPPAMLLLEKRRGDRPPGRGRESVSGLLMYEDDAIRDFAERRDPCPNVVTGPRKWLKRIREARAQIDAFLTGRAG
jgi:hypothetical protein